MKKYLCIALIFTTFCLIGQRERGLVNIGLHVMPEISSLRYNRPSTMDVSQFIASLPKYRPRIGAGIGMNAYISIKPSFGIMTTVDYVQKRYALETGGVAIINNNGSNMSVMSDFYEYKVNNFDVSIMPTVRLGSRLAISAGGYWSNGLGDREIKIKNYSSWINDIAYDKEGAIGVTGGITLTLDNFYLAPKILYDLSEREDIVLTDQNGLPLGQIGTRSWAMGLSIGYWIF